VEMNHEVRASIRTPIPDSPHSSRRA